jgi:hypothetical protein
MPADVALTGTVTLPSDTGTVTLFELTTGTVMLLGLLIGNVALPTVALTVPVIATDSAVAVFTLTVSAILTG